jgi:hypothetical protein
VASRTAGGTAGGDGHRPRADGAWDPSEDLEGRPALCQGASVAAR